jgi:hypothetical protein
VCVALYNSETRLVAVGAVCNIHLPRNVGSDLADGGVVAIAAALGNPKLAALNLSQTGFTPVGFNRRALRACVRVCACAFVRARLCAFVRVGVSERVRVYAYRPPKLASLPTHLPAHGVLDSLPSPPALPTAVPVCVRPCYAPTAAAFSVGLAAAWGREATAAVAASTQQPSLSRSQWASCRLRSVLEALARCPQMHTVALAGGAQPCQPLTAFLAQPFPA